MDGLILAGGKQQIKGAREDSRVYYVPKTDLRYSLVEHSNYIVQEFQHGKRLMHSV